MTQILSLDLGNSGAKGVTESGIFFIEGAVSVERKSVMNGEFSDAKHSRKAIDNIRIERGGIVYKVGKLATLDDDYRAPVGMNRYKEDDYIDLIMQAAFAVTKTSGDVKMVVGLPIDGYTDSYKSLVANRFKGLHTIKQPKSKEDLSVNVVEVAVQPEPVGTYFGQLLNIETMQIIDPTLKQSKVGIIDIGEFTVDLLVMDRGKFVASQSKSLDYASNKVLQVFSDNVFNDIQYRIPDSKLKQASNEGVIVTATGTHDIKHHKANAIQEVSGLMISSISRVWTDADDMYKIFIAGGGATNFKTAIKTRYSQAVLVSNSRFSNAQGMYNWGVSKWQK